MYLYVRGSVFSPFAPCGNGFAQYIGCSGVVGSVSASGAVLVDLSSQITITVNGGGSYLYAALGGEVTFKIGNALP